MPAVRVFLAHGASGSAASMMPHVRWLEARGIAAAPVQLPRTRAERAAATFLAAAPPAADVGVGGHSFGGRVAALLAAEHAYAGLLLLSYPLHPPGRSERWEERTAHWPNISCPVLLISGDRDPFARIELLRAAVERLPRGELVVFPGVGHGIGPVLEPAMERAVEWLRALSTLPG
ncbi:MAG TPA: alpha/beta family hydrolase [Candidatus Limnocylindria bacterium]